MRFCISASLLLTFIFASCSIPNLDPSECSASRTVVREFYSYHFGNEMKASPNGLDARKRFLTPELFKRAGSAVEGTDPFTTGTTDIPKAFRAGECRVISTERAEYDVLLFWKDDTRTEQKTIKVQAAKVDDAWLIDKIER
ncbi:MAG: hypothetical protein HOP17_07155 [Acidobacteria bacterium]|nr:hypothetical protein [Acidobacteriota bacterium]